MGQGGITAEPPLAAAPPPDSEPGRFGRYLTGALFLLPAAFVLVVWVIYPAVYTIIRSFFGQQGYIGTWVGIDNYRHLFTTHTLLTAIKNNAIWVLVVPAIVTAFGLVFAVLTERVRWSVAFKTVVFLPMAISAFATGVTWRIMYQQDPDVGAINALTRSVKGVFSPAGVLSSAAPSTGTVIPNRGGLILKTPIHPGGTALLGLTAIPPADVPAGAKQAATPTPRSDEIAGTVWRDFKPGGGVPGKVETGEQGLPGVTVDLVQNGKTVQRTTTGDDGSFTFTGVKSGTFQAAVGAATFAKPFGGYAWLGPSLITPALLIAYIWIWAGFAMVVIAAGLSSMPREVLEAARTDGATEWQTFRRVTVPLLAPVLSVVFITMIINVLKVFDIVLALAPESTQSNANVIALAMWRTAFGGVNDFGTGSAIAVFLFILVIPVLALNIRRFKREV
ncbi:MAG TPA: ABC transporter permease subunit [Gaiellaceae bacterium]|nr:ABC transporter permease subunit [Gaiellaceae bacterium]HVZ21022.1 ABC transporter permease subunit [Vicinamibacterales bacterium]